MAILKVENHSLNGIVGLAFTDIRKLGLSVSPRRNPQVAGHVILPELNINTWTDEKSIWLPVVEELAEMASKNILRYPIG